MALEQVPGKKEKLSVSCDVYGLGVILYEPLAGQVAGRIPGLPEPG